MAIPVPASLVEFILLGPDDDRRQLQDSPLLGDVWIAFGKRPDRRFDLLITPHMTQPAASIADAIEKGVGRANKEANIAFLQGIVAAKLSFEEVLRVVVPMSKWWSDKWMRQPAGKPKGDGGTSVDTAPAHRLLGYDMERTARAFNATIQAARAWYGGVEAPDEPRHDAAPGATDAAGRPREPDARIEVLPLDRYIVLTALILWASRQPPPEQRTPPEPTPVSTSEQVMDVLRRVTLEDLAQELRRMRDSIASDAGFKPLVWHVSLNRTATTALVKSIPAVKADAAKTLFKVDCRQIAWAVIDSGIDGRHGAFNDRKGDSRIRRSFDFTNFRRIVNLSNSNDDVRQAAVRTILDGRERLLHEPKDPDQDLKRLSADLREGRSIHWDLVEKFVEIRREATPLSIHGTHVAGIIGASKESAEAAAGGVESDDFADGMCPDIQLYDFRVLGPSIRDTEFAIIAALQFIRYLNDRDNFFTIHGVNLRLSIPHDVRNFACGRTPICNECERLNDSGVVVVAAAGNHGYKSFETKDGAYESYAAFSITDPGNAESVVTVGATHRSWPHTYGVSFFSSRGPTGDGRIKPDLVAPGERIRAPVSGSSEQGGEWGDLDGTSMAAPHVSGAAAMLLARYEELIGQPRRVKSILCESATDLGRERSFQGHGMLDVLRAFQSI
jgi:serine protease AprX